MKGRKEFNRIKDKLVYSPGCAPSYVIEGIEDEKKMREENHTIMCLKAEITSRSAANQVLGEKVKMLQREVDHLEEGLRLAKEQVANLLRLNQFRHDAESGPDDPGKT